MADNRAACTATTDAATIATGEVRLIDFDPSLQEHRDAFKALNEWWIKKWFKMEQSDTKALDNPEGILSNGGQIVLAETTSARDALPVFTGVCALYRAPAEHPYEYELAKMGVHPDMQRQGQ